MARNAIVTCAKWHAHAFVGTKCESCSEYHSGDCVLRVYLESKGEPDAWEVEA